MGLTRAARLCFYRQIERSLHRVCVCARVRTRTRGHARSQGSLRLMSPPFRPTLTLKLPFKRIKMMKATTPEPNQVDEGDDGNETATSVSAREPVLLRFAPLLNLATRAVASPAVSMWPASSNTLLSSFFSRKQYGRRYAPSNAAPKQTKRRALTILVSLLIYGRAWTNTRCPCAQPDCHKTVAVGYLSVWVDPSHPDGENFASASRRSRLQQICTRRF